MTLAITERGMSRCGPFASAPSTAALSKPTKLKNASTRPRRSFSIVHTFELDLGRIDDAAAVNEVANHHSQNERDGRDLDRSVVRVERRISRYAEPPGHDCRHDGDGVGQGLARSR